MKEDTFYIYVMQHPIVFYFLGFCVFFISWLWLRLFHSLAHRYASGWLYFTGLIGFLLIPFTYTGYVAYKVKVYVEKRELDVKLQRNGAQIPKFDRL